LRLLGEHSLVGPSSRADSRRSWGIDCALDGPIKVNVTNGLLDHDGARSQGGYPRGLATDENMRDPSCAEYFLDRRDAVSIAQPRVDYHQVRFELSGGGYCISLGYRDGANAVTHGDEHIGE